MGWLFTYFSSFIMTIAPSLALMQLTQVIVFGDFVTAHSTIVHSLNLRFTKQSEVVTLDPGRSIDRELMGGESHRYQIHLESGQYLKIIVEQRGIDVVLAIFGPDEKELADAGSASGTRGTQSISLVSDAAGKYLLSVRSLDKTAVAGHYELRILDLHTASASDRALVDAERLTMESSKSADLGRFDSAISTLEKALAIQERVRGPEHQDIARSFNSLAQLHQAKGDYAEAEIFYRRALAIEGRLGPEQPEAAATLTSLADLYLARADYSRAEPLYKRALAIYETHLGADHPNVSRVLSHLGKLYYSQGRFAIAEQLYQRALVIEEKVHGLNHPGSATALDNLGELYLAIGDYAKAEATYRQAMAIWTKTLGPQHPNIARTLNNLAIVYYNQNKYDAAEPLLINALSIDEKVYGQSTTLAVDLNNLGELYRAQGKYKKAEPLFLRSLRIWENSAGPDSPNVALCLNNLAKLYSSAGKYKDAEPLFNRSLGIYKKALVQDPNYASALENYAELLRKTDRGTEAVIVESQARALRNKQAAEKK